MVTDKINNYKSNRKRINKGTIDGTKYFKDVSFSTAVLWKDKQLSLPPEIIECCKECGVTELVFTDLHKLERWIFDFANVLKLGILKSEGQEKQLYFPISLARKIKIGVE